MKKSQEQQLFKEINRAWLPPPDLTISEWADSERKIPPEASAEPGQWRTSRAEYQREIMNAISNPFTERVVVMTAAQVGKTEILLNTIGYFIDQEPGPILCLNPTLEMGEAFSKDRLAPMIRDTPVLQNKIKDPRSRDSGNTLRHKKFVGGHITIAGANSPASLASRPIRILLCDEVDRYPMSAGTEGDPLTLAMKRTQNFWNRRIVWVSTPTLLGTSRIEKAFNASSREEWCVPCPTCGEYQPFTWEQISYKDLPEPVMTCTKCGAIHNEIEWKSGQERGIWIASNPDEKKARGFHMNAFASAWATWKNLVEQYQEAFRNGEEELKVWWNTVLGLPYENTNGAIEVEALESHREKYNAELPDGVLVLTCGVDTQDDRLECEVVGWGAGRESWGIEYRVFYGDPGLKEVWQALDDFLSKTWSYSNGDKLGLSCTCIDSAGHHTDEVYKFCKPRARRNIFAIVGRGQEGMPSVSKPTRNNRRHVTLFKLGVTTIKGTLFSRLKVEERGAGFCHFPVDDKNGHRGYDAVYFKGLLSERMVVKRVRGRDTITWEPRSPGIRNEPLDTRVYATGALEIFNPNFEQYARRRSKNTEKTSMPKLKQPVMIKADKTPEFTESLQAKKTEIKKSVERTNTSSVFIRRGLRL
ncbi:MAG: phage terminase large subunit family protein [Synergistaceae bacterium]|nr:phage terminase large subunit family protein [Synergistaceae bacterium]